MTRPARSRSACSQLPAADAVTPAAHGEDPALDPFVADHRTLGVALRDGAAQQDIDPEPAERVGRNGRKPRREAWEQSRPGLDQHDVRLLWIDAPEIARQRGAGQFRDRPCQFHPGRPAADDDKPQQPVALGRIIGVLRSLEGEQNAAPHCGGVLDRLQPRRDLLPFVVTEIRMTGARRDDELVIAQPMAAESYRSGRQIDRGHPPEEDRGVRLAAQHAADRCGDVGRR